MLFRSSPRHATVEIKRGILNTIKLVRDAGRTGILSHHSYHGEYLRENYSNADNAMYQIKYYLGLFSLLPSRILELLGHECYKGDSFSQAKSLFSSAAWRFIENISNIRENWEKHEEHPYIGNKVPRWLQQQLGLDYFLTPNIFLDEVEKICMGIE